MTNTWKLVLAVMFGLTGLSQAKMPSLFSDINNESRKNAVSFSDDNNDSKSLHDILQGCREYPECAIVLLILCTSMTMNSQTAPSF